MKIHANDINRKGYLQHMVAKDMFIEQAKQVFNAKTGKWLGTIDTFGELDFEPENDKDEQEPEIQVVNPAQTSLF